uniref:CRAL-TRIO domain-containing protein n=1 Tax=Globodera pallida TaxID=36090 RepID=A0A183BK20_GLOPA
MSKRPSTELGEPLSDGSLELVAEVRHLCLFPRHPNFDSDFNIYRFIACAERTHRSRREVVESAAKALDQHIRVRKCMKLDEVPSFPMEQNRLFRDLLMPFGRITEGVTDSRNRLLWFIEYRSMELLSYTLYEVIRVELLKMYLLKNNSYPPPPKGRSAVLPMEQNRLFRDLLMPFGRITEGVTDSRNRLLWFIEYRSMSVEKIAHGIRSSESIRFQFWQFEQMLRMVNRQERKSGRLSSIRHVIDMAGYEINPFTTLFVSSGTLSYYSQLFHYDNYPELIYPIELVNIAKWIQLPYRMIRGMMPSGFTDRFRLYDGNFLQKLTAEIPAEFIPQSLGGQNEAIRCVPASPLLHHWQPKHRRILDKLQCFHIGARKSKAFRVQIEGAGGTNILSWYLRTDGDIFLGVFFEPDENSQCQQNGKSADSDSLPADQKGQQNKVSVGGEHQMADQLEWVYPWFKLSARLHHEWDCVDCSRPGSYWLLFSNKHNWLNRRTIEVIVQIERVEESGKSKIRNVFPEGKEPTIDGETEEETLSLREYLQIEPEQMFAGASCPPTHATEEAISISTLPHVPAGTFQLAFCIDIPSIQFVGVDDVMVRPMIVPMTPLRCPRQLHCLHILSIRLCRDGF